MAKRKTRGALKPLPQPTQGEEALPVPGYPVKPALEYNAQVQPLITEMLEEYARDLGAIGMERDAIITMDESLAEKARRQMNNLRKRFERLFAREAPRIAEDLVGGLDKASAVSTAGSLKQASEAITLKTKQHTPEMLRTMSAAVKENVALIKSIPEKFHHQIFDSVISSVSPGGHGLKTIVDTLTEYDGVTRRRAEFIALDQTRKVTGAMNAERMKTAGAKKFRWIHSGGGAEPRPLHKYELNGKIFSYDDLPIIDERTGERGLPGQLPNCKCQAQPIIDFEDV